MKFQTAEPPPADIPLAPMIDIVFLLLSFFIVTAQITENEKDLEVQVPTSEKGEESQRQYNEIIINVREDGTTSINGQIFTPEQLEAKLVRLVKASNAVENDDNDTSNQPVRLRGDSAAAYQNIVNVIDICQSAGIWNISFAIQSKQPPS